MPTINDWRSTPSGTLDINWKAVEEHLGFELHENLKDFYSRIIGGNDRWGNISDVMKYKPLKLIKSWCNPKFDNWIVDDEFRDFTEVTLCPLERTDKQYLCNFFDDSFFGNWTGGHNFGRRAYVGDFYLSIGSICLIFNNDSGKFEWIDFGYGYYEIYENNPYGIIADTAQEFLDKFNFVKEYY